jgi:predicted RNase H-like HicB family nuclease
MKELCVERKFTLAYWIDYDWYVGKLKEVPGVFSQGATLQELEENIQDAYRMIMSEHEENEPSFEIRSKELSFKV